MTRKSKIIVFVLIFLFAAALVIGAANRKGREGGKFLSWLKFQKSQNQPAAPTPPNGGSPNPSQPGSIPGQHQALYDRLEGKLDNFIAKVEARGNKSNSSVIYSAGLITANPNYGDLLLTPDIYDMSIKYIDQLKKIGVTGITVDINFPLLDPNFRNGEKYQQFLDFYKKLSNEIKKRGLNLNIEVQPIFPDYSTLPVKQYYQGLTFDTYKQRVADMLVTIAKELQPHYLTVANEPDTAQANTGFPIGSLDNSLGMVNFFLNKLKDSGASNIKYGAGFGTWQKDYQTWTNRYTKETSLDFLNIHIYPADGDFLDRALAISDTAKQNGKSVAIHEAWLYKWQLGDAAGIAVSKEVYSLDAYSFWAPLDQKFIQALVYLAREKQYEYVSPFFSNYFFGYLEYEQAKDMSAPNRLSAAVKQGIKDALSGKVSSTGEFYKKLIAQ
ncbi:MAG: hypothetical protein AAB837_01780 [Patescibacteria group bacterium]